MERKGLGNEKTVGKGGIGNVGAACSPQGDRAPLPEKI